MSGRKSYATTARDDRHAPRRVGLGLPALAEEVEDLAETVRAQGEVIRELREELARVRQEQQRSQDRVRALEDQAASERAASGVTPEYVDRRIEAFEEAPESRLFLSGYGAASYVDADDDPSTFNIQFNPIFHFRLTDRLHFNAEPEIGLEKHEGETETEFELEFTTIDFLVNDWLTLTTGKMLLPFNVWGPQLHPQWINKLASSPPIYGTGGIIPILGDVGIMASGGTELWSEDAKLRYALYAVNGPILEEEDGDEAELLDFEFENVPDDNDNKSVGGRIGFLPIPNLEIGASFLTGRGRGPGGRFNLAGVDAWYWFRGLELRGEYVRRSRKVSGVNPDVWGYWVQAAYRLRHQILETTGFRGFLARLEPVIRWGEIQDLGALNREQLGA